MLNMNSKGKRTAVKTVTEHDSVTGKCLSFTYYVGEILYIELLYMVSLPPHFASDENRLPRNGYQSTRHTVISSRDQVVTGQLVTYVSRHTVNSSQAST